MNRAASAHDVIRVRGARVDNLKDVSVSVPKRRRTVLTGVSGSGTSSLVFGTIAAESQRLVNETSSALVQGFMPTLARPEVGVREGSTTAILVDQERMDRARSTMAGGSSTRARRRISSPGRSTLTGEHLATFVSGAAKASASRRARRHPAAPCAFR